VNPTGGGASLVWGDPDRGFVGRPDGGGPAGGYGVYERPVSALARRHGARPARLRGARPADVYAQLLAGRPVMTWVGLSDGPYRTWRTREGRRVTGNFGEHTVVLTGLRGNNLAVNDPLDGRRKTWSKGQFELMWRRLGRRALFLS
ncbi:MAG: C39 family peptidase, partial [Actinobacteria bacterium]|nr:C39 family peptidase [Actinomycetota bacterium]